jgi:hypothetical protein
MKTLNTLLLTLSLLPISAISSESINYKFKGDQQAASICKAVISDDARALDRKLSIYQKQDRAKAQYLKKHSTALLSDFSCNDKSLFEFADNVGAYKVVRYLDSYKNGRPTVYIDEIAAN